MIAANANQTPEDDQLAPRPYTKRTREQRAEAVDIALRLLKARQTTADIKAVLRRKYPGLGHRQAMTDIARARERQLAELGRPKVEHQADAYAFYDSVVKNSKEETRDRIKAQERIDKLLGLEAPQKLAGPDGGPLTLSALLVASAAVPAPEPPTARPINQFDPDAYLAQLEADGDGRDS